MLSPADPILTTTRIKESKRRNFGLHIIWLLSEKAAMKLGISFFEGVTQPPHPTSFDANDDDRKSGQRLFAAVHRIQEVVVVMIRLKPSKIFLSSEDIREYDQIRTTWEKKSDLQFKKSEDDSARRNVQSRIGLLTEPIKPK